MKILYYNWADYLSKKGGGVTTYLKNIMTSDAIKEHQVFTISAGQAYDSCKKPYWREVLLNGNPTDRYEFVNSPVNSPAWACFGNKNELANADFENSFIDFVNNIGSFDVIHFHNIEGIPVNTLSALRKTFPATKILFSFHNYYPICPQANLWKWREEKHCDSFHNGTCYNNCSYLPLWAVGAVRLKRRIKRETFQAMGEEPAPPAQNKELNKSVVPKKTLRHSLKYCIKSVLINIPRWHSKNENSATAKYFSSRREYYKNVINENCDAILCVSRRVKEICENYGYDSQKLQVSYIGTKHAKTFLTTPDRIGSIIKPEIVPQLTYLGYAREDKGFFFFLDVLEAMPAELAAKLSILLCAYLENPSTSSRINKLADKFKKIDHINGYTSDQLPEILESTTIGIVPVLWEDNLPQVAIEMHCHKIPLLCSDRGGPSELGNNNDFIFKAGDINDFIAKLSTIMEGKITHEEYRKNELAPIDINDHVKDLIKLYSEL